MRPARVAAALAAALISACAVKPLPPEVGSAKFGIDVTWHGHSCFTIKDSVNRTIVIDPFDPTVGYGQLRLSADALLITHPHFDHDYRPAVRTRAAMLELVESTGTANVASGLIVTGIAAAHDAEQGQVNGPDTMYAFQMGGLRCLHVGDLGQVKLTEFQRKMIGAVDVLFIPVGGVTTIGPKQAKKIVDELKPGAVFPMHYGDIRFYKLEPVESFARLFPPAAVQRPGGSTVRVRVSDLTDRPIVYILSPSNRN
jgi:L-ascorbate metabolism protein UlaG (beta-lactamase superfamily)